MIQKLLSVVLLVVLTTSVKAQLFYQDFESANSVTDYINNVPNTNREFNGISTSRNNLATTINNGTLQFTRTGRASIFAFRNFNFNTNPNFVQLKFDFEMSNFQTGTQEPIFSIFLGNNFSSASFGSNSTFASRFGIQSTGSGSNFKISTIDNIGGAPSFGDFSGKQSIIFVVNNSGVSKSYMAPNGNTNIIDSGKMDVWVGTFLGINGFSLKNTISPIADISGFKIQATSASGQGVFSFDNIELKDLNTDSSNLPTVDLINTPEAYLGRKHPRIWTSYTERQKIVDNIRQHPWALSLFNQLVSRQQNVAKITHKNNPSALLSTIPQIPGDRLIHREILNDAVESGILYFLTDDEDYAQRAADVFHQYAKIISPLNANTFQFYTPNFNHLIQTRELFPRVAMIYDFIQPFLKKNTTTVYDVSTNSRVDFSFNNAQATFEVLANNVIEEGANNSNHPVLELPGGLYNVLCMEDDEVRATFFDKLLNGVARSSQPGINWMLSHFSPVERLWPESAGYGKFTHAIFLQSLNIVDAYRPDLNLIDNNKDIIESIFTYENILYPNGATMAYGDIGRNFTDHAHIYRGVLKIADRKGYTDIKERAISTLQKIYAAEGGYNPVIENQRLEWNNPLQLLWGVNVDESVNSTGETLHATNKISHAGVVMQRNYSGVNDEQNGLMYYTHGGTYVHTHAGGIDMELYGSGYVIGPDYGADAFGSDIHEQYAVSYAAHNTVITNGTSGRGPKLNGNSTWQNITDPIVLQGREPKEKIAPIADNFRFTTQFLDDHINNVNQQRTNGIIRTSATTGYYIDIFRSVSNGVNNFHDYLFHGLGDVLQVKEGVTSLPLVDTPERYKNDVGDTRKQPGWRWFSEAKTSNLTNAAVQARFDIQFDNKYLHVNVPGGVAKEYSTALSPPTKQVRNGYDKKDTQVFVMRKYGEAWDEPFVAVYEPSSSEESTIKTTSYIYDNEKVVGLKVVSEVNGQQIVDYILANDTERTINLTDVAISFTGSFAIVRSIVKNNKTEVSLYLGQGTELSFLDVTITGDSDGKAYREYTLDFEVLSTQDQQKKTKKRIYGYPNPSNGFFNINNIPKTVKNLQVAIYNVEGRLITTKKYFDLSGALTIDISDEKKGMYFVKLYLEEPIYVKLIKR